MFLNTLQRNTAELGDKTAIAFIDGPRRSYRELGEDVARCAKSLLDCGIQPGDRVAAQLPKCLSFITLHLAAMRIGAIFLPLNPAYPSGETRYFLEDSGACLLFTEAGNRDAMAAISPDLPNLRMTYFLEDDDDFDALSRQADDLTLPPMPNDPNMTAMMLYTSGTTSRPKGALITHGNLSANIAALHDAWGWRADDKLLHALPIFHVHGLVVALHGALHAGASAFLLREFDAARTFDLLLSRRFSVFMGVPTMHRRLFNHAAGVTHDLGFMRLMTSGSDRLPDDLFFGYQRVFNVTLLERYGMTETGMNLSNPLHGERRVGSVGMPLPGVSARVVDATSEAELPDNEVGELQIQGDHVFAGYWRQPEKTNEAFSDDGWLRTGDMALRESDGYYTLKGRAKDLIISGGLNIYPPEVELVLMAHPGVAACAVIGCPDEEWGEQVVAVIVPKPGQNLDEETMINCCREELAAYKAPRRVVFVDELPRNALGKVQKARLRESVCR